MARSFIDTNVLVYADSADEPAKQELALAVLREHMLAGSGVVSTQVLQEFVAVALKRLRLPVPLLRARLSFYGRFQVIGISAAMISAALDLHLLHQLSIWDALIVQSAVRAGCETVLSEDLCTGATIGGVRLINPFG